MTNANILAHGFSFYAETDNMTESQRDEAIDLLKTHLKQMPVEQVKALHARDNSDSVELYDLGMAAIKPITAAYEERCTLASAVSVSNSYPTVSVVAVNIGPQFGPQFKRRL